MANIQAIVHTQNNSSRHNKLATSVEHQEQERSIQLHPFTIASSCSLQTSKSDGGTGMTTPAPVHRTNEPNQLFTLCYDEQILRHHITVAVQINRYISFEQILT